MKESKIFILILLIMLYVFDFTVLANIILTSGVLTLIVKEWK
jgi:hypothetical protein